MPLWNTESAILTKVISALNSFALVLIRSSGFDGRRFRSTFEALGHPFPWLIEA
jgi:hypothetical protein